MPPGGTPAGRKLAKRLPSTLADRLRHVLVAAVHGETNRRGDAKAVPVSPTDGLPWLASSAPAKNAPRAVFSKPGISVPTVAGLAAVWQANLLERW